MRAVLIGLLILASLMPACGGGDEVYEGAVKCAELISSGSDCPPTQNQSDGQGRSDGATDSPQATPPAGTANEESRVYIDASESMQGFASAPDNTFVKVVESLGYAMPGCRLYKYGASSRRASAPADGELPFAREIRFSQELRKSTFYDLGFNEDDKLINHLAAEKVPARSVLLTDGVYSARDTELQSEVVKAADRWLSQGRFLGILVFTSPFDGRLYSENRRGWTERVNVSARPFYAFVFSPTEKGFRDLIDQLGSEVKVIATLTFPREAVSCAVSPEDIEGLEKKDAPPRRPFYLQKYGAGIFGKNDQAKLAYEFRCTPAADYPMTGFKLEVALDAYSWQQDAFKKNQKAPQFDYEYTEPGTTLALPTASPGAEAPGAASPTPTLAARRRSNLKLILSKDNTSNHSLYHVIFNLSGKTLNPIVRALSTQDDSLAGEAGKTYRFYEFISSLTTVHMQGREAVRLPPRVFVTIANK